MRLLSKIILSFMVIGVIPVVFVMGLNYYKAKALIIEQVLSKLDGIASDREIAVDSFVDNALSRHASISSRLRLRGDLEKYNTTREKTTREAMSVSIHAARSAVPGVFEEIYIIDPSGVVVAATNEARIDTDLKDKEYFIAGKKEQFFDVRERDTGVRLLVSGPLYSPVTPNKFLGVMVVEENTKMLNDVVNNYSGLGTTGESFLAKRDEKGDALFITNSRLDSNAAFRRTVSKDNKLGTIISALDKKEVLLTDAVDYLGNPVIGVGRYIDRTGWGLAVKINRDEALAPVDELFRTFILIMFLVIMLVVAMGLIFARSLTQPITRLTEVVNEISHGKLDVKLDKLDTQDEIGDLARAFERVVVSLKLAMRSQMQGEKKVE